MDLSTSYLGLSLEHPLVPGASPLTDELDGVRRLEDAGAAAIVLRSLFEEQLVQEEHATRAALDEPAEAFSEALTYLPEPHEFRLGPDDYLEHLRLVKQSVAVPVIASLNGTTRGGWVRYAALLQEAGADALELNLYDVPVERELSGEGVEQRARDVVAAVAEQTSLPLAVKLSPFYSALVNFSSCLGESGARALVLFNRFFQPDIDPVEQQAERGLRLSDSSELPLRLRWLALLRGRVPLDLAVSGGVHGPEDAVKAVMCGADCVQLVSALLRGGPGRLAEIRRGMELWLEEQELESLARIRGSMSWLRCPDPMVYERANYIDLLQGWEGIVHHPLR